MATSVLHDEAVPAWPSWQKDLSFSREQVIRRFPLRGNLETKRSSLAKGSQQEREFARLYGEIKAELLALRESRSAPLSFGRIMALPCKD